MEILPTELVFCSWLWYCVTLVSVHSRLIWNWNHINFNNKLENSCFLNVKLHTLQLHRLPHHRYRQRNMDDLVPVGICTQSKRKIDRLQFLWTFHRAIRIGMAWSLSVRIRWYEWSRCNTRSLYRTDGIVAIFSSSKPLFHRWLKSPEDVELTWKRIMFKFKCSNFKIHISYQTTGNKIAPQQIKSTKINIFAHVARWLSPSSLSSIIISATLARIYKNSHI